MTKIKIIGTFMDIDCDSLILDISNENSNSEILSVLQNERDCELESKLGLSDNNIAISGYKLTDALLDEGIERIYALNPQGDKVGFIVPTTRMEPFEEINCFYFDMNKVPSIGLEILGVKDFSKEDTQDNNSLNWEK